MIPRSPRVAALLSSAVSVLVATPLSAQSGLFDAAVVVADETNRFEAMADLDGDGATDLLGFWWETNHYFAGDVHAWFGDGAGAMVQAPWVLPLVATWGTNGQEPVGIRTGNFNGDGMDDFVVFFRRSIVVYESAGTAEPTPWTFEVINPSNGFGTIVHDLVVADFDDDGLDDIAYIAPSNVITIVVLLNDGLGEFAPSDKYWKQIESGPVPDAVGRRILWTAELNGDGLPDLVMHRTPDAPTSSVDMYFIEDGLTIGTYSSPPIVSGALAIGDVDGDLDDDVVSFAADGRYRVLRRDGPAAYSVMPLRTGGPATKLADVDGDGDLDGICCGGGGGGGGPIYGPIYNSQASRFEVSINDGSGVFAPAFQFHGLGSHRIVGADDLDGDGDVELIGGRAIYYPDGPIVAPPAPPGFDLAQRQVHDMDGDGDLDISSGIDGHQRNDGVGVYSTGLTGIEPPSSGVWSAKGHPGDFDGDGDTDLIVSRMDLVGLSLEFQEHHLVRNDGGGSFTPAGPAGPAGVRFAEPDVALGDDPARSRTVDVDGDGFLDLVGMANDDWYLLSANDGTGYFPTTMQLGANEAFRAAGDVDGDLVNDLIVAGTSGPGLMRGVGRFQFGPLEPIPAATVPYAGRPDAALADLDLDGDLDLVVLVDKYAGSLQTSTSFELHSNDGLGGFGPPVLPFPGLQLASDARLAIVDFDDDGRPDIAVSSVFRAESTGVAMLNSASGWSLVHQAVPMEALFDIDGDGDLDSVGELVTHGTRFAVPDDGMAYQYGTSSTVGCGTHPLLGALGPVPTLGARGPFRVGETIEIRGRALPPFSVALLYIGFNQVEFPDLLWEGTTTLLWPPKFLRSFFTFGDPAVELSGRFTMNYTVQPDVPGLGPVFHQAVVYDLCAPDSFLTTNGLTIDYE